MILFDNYKKEEKIQGVVFDMSPSESFAHANVNGNIYAMLHSLLKNSTCHVYMENADLYMDKTDKEYVIPDIMVVCDTMEFKEHTTKYYGKPKFVVETLSPSTAHKDRTTKKDFYARKGVSEYWILDYKAKFIEIYCLKDGRYDLVNTYILQEDPEEDNFNGKEIITLREFPVIKMMLEGIFDRVGEMEKTDN